MLLHLLKGASPFSGFFYIAVQPVPNLFAHLLLALCISIAGPASAIKITVSIIALVFLLGYHYLARSIRLFTGIPLLGFLMIYCFPLKMGLYGFLLGAGAMMLACSYYISAFNVKNKYSVARMLLLIAFTWFSHLFAFLLLLLLVIIYEVILLMRRTNDYGFGKRILHLLPFLPFLLLFAWFYNYASGTAPLRHADVATLHAWLISLTAMENFGTDAEFHLKKLFYLMLIVAAVATISQKRKITTREIFFISALAALILLYYLMPDDVLSGGMINLRILYIFLVFVCICIDMLTQTGIFYMAKVALIIIAICIASVNEYKSIQPYSRDIAQMTLVADKIPEGSTVLPLNYSDDYLEYDFLLYFAALNEIIILDNPEAATPNGIVRWNASWKQADADFLRSRNPDINAAAGKFQSDFIAGWRSDWEKKDVFISSGAVQIKKSIK